MLVRALARFSVALLAVGTVAACSASPESVESSNEAYSIYLPPPPQPPVWPAPNAAYCSADPSCQVSADYPWFWVEPATITTLETLHCTQPYSLTSSSVPESTFAVCFDSPVVRAAFQPYGVTCDHCLPALPAGELYVFTGGPIIRPNCPSGCPSGGASGPGHTSPGGGTTTTTSKQ